MGAGHSFLQETLTTNWPYHKLGRMLPARWMAVWDFSIWDLTPRTSRISRGSFNGYWTIMLISIPSIIAFHGECTFRTLMAIVWRCVWTRVTSPMELIFGKAGIAHCQ